MRLIAIQHTNTSEEGLISLERALTAVGEETGEGWIQSCRIFERGLGIQGEATPIQTASGMAIFGATETVRFQALIELGVGANEVERVIQLLRARGVHVAELDKPIPCVQEIPLEGERHFGEA